MGQTLKNLAVREDQLLVGQPAIATYLLAGKAKITLHSVRTGTRHSYRVEVAKVKTEAGGWKSNHGGHGPWYVWSHTAEGWQGVGYVRKTPHRSGELQFLNETTRKVRRVLPASDERVQGFKWLMGRLVRGIELPSHAQVWRSNRCGRCAAELISHYKIIGFGPTCCGHLGINAHAIFNRLASLGEAPLNRRLEVVREMVYGSNLSKADQTALSLLPGIAGDYAKAHLSAA